MDLRARSSDPAGEDVFRLWVTDLNASTTRICPLTEFSSLSGICCLSKPTARDNSFTTKDSSMIRMILTITFVQSFAIKDWLKHIGTTWTF